MPREASGEIRRTKEGLATRVRVGAKRETFLLSSCRTDEEAKARSLLVSRLAKRFRVAGTPEAEARRALDMVAAASERGLRGVLVVVEELLGGDLEDIPGTDAPPSFKEVAEEWTSGRLHERFPDQVRMKRTADDDVARLAIHILPVIADTRIDRVTLEQCEEVMRRLPSDLASATRRNVARTMGRVFKLAVYPLRVLGRSPLPDGFVPKAKQNRALAYLYPSEDARLLACQAVPLAYRILWGFLVREGMRESEALGLSVRDVDLERGAVRLDRNKTDDPRAWALDPTVTRALRAYVARYRSDAEPTDVLFTDEHERPVSPWGLAERLRSHLETVGLKTERPELFQTTANRLQIRVHDLRGTFVTVSLANGRSESWISDRTGHRSSQMIAKYKRTARTLEELDQGTFAPFDLAVPELSPIPAFQALLAKLSEGAAEGDRMPPDCPGGGSPRSSARSSPPRFPRENRVSAGSLREGRAFLNRRSRVRIAPGAPPEGQTGGKRSDPTERVDAPATTPTDPVEGALADALVRASEAGAWEVVAQLARELEARRKAREAPEVVSLDAERKRRERP